VLVVLDDVGFAQLGCFGSDLDTPRMDALAAAGLRYTNFHTTALCSPTRACLLTGRNHHANGMGRIIELATGFPGYDARIPAANGFLSEMLVEQGYATYAVGKWHLTPAEEGHHAATRVRWPLSRGFERFYGFFSGETHQYAPALISDNHQVPVPARWQDGYHLTEDLVDTSIGLVEDLRAIDIDKPFFLYLCPGACHSPHQVPAPWIDAYRGHFDAGWDAWREATLARQQSSGLLGSHVELSPRPEWVPAWESLSADERRLYARYMEAFAGFLSHTDHELGRLVDHLAQRGELDNSLLLVCSDNGASSEGGPTGSLNDIRSWNAVARPRSEALARIDEIGGPRCHNNYPWGWTVAGNTPFRRWKRETHEGGTADPLIVHWPRGIDARGEFRRQYVHAIDVVPTVLDLLGATPPATIGGIAQRPLDGVGFSYTFDGAESPGRHETQYYEMFGCRALYHEGFKAVTYHPIMDNDFDSDTWELYDVTADPSECHDLAQTQPDRLADMIDRWWAEAERHQVLPLDARPISELVLDRPGAVPPRSTYRYRRGMSMVPEAVAADVRNRSHTVTADVELTDDSEGVLISQGSILGGWTLFVAQRRLHYVHNLAGFTEDRVSSETRLALGRHRLAFAFTRTGQLQGTGALSCDGEPLGSVEISWFTGLRFSLTGAGLTCARSADPAVCDDYEAPYEFTGVLHEVTITVDGAPYQDRAGEAEIAVQTQ
jgi:arylsulfatase